MVKINLDLQNHIDLWCTYCAEQEYEVSVRRGIPWVPLNPNEYGIDQSLYNCIVPWVEPPKPEKLPHYKKELAENVFGIATKENVNDEYISWHIRKVVPFYRGRDTMIDSGRTATMKEAKAAIQKWHEMFDYSSIEKYNTEQAKVYGGTKEEYKK